MEASTPKAVTVSLAYQEQVIAGEVVEQIQEQIGPERIEEQVGDIPVTPIVVDSRGGANHSPGAASTAHCGSGTDHCRRDDTEHRGISFCAGTSKSTGISRGTS